VNTYNYCPLHFLELSCSQLVGNFKGRNPYELLIPLITRKIDTNLFLDLSHIWNKSFLWRLIYCFTSPNVLSLNPWFNELQVVISFESCVGVPSRYFLLCVSAKVYSESIVQRKHASNNLCLYTHKVTRLSKTLPCQQKILNPVVRYSCNSGRVSTDHECNCITQLCHR